MAVWTVIVKNNSGSDQAIEDLGLTISDGTQIILSDEFTYSEIADSDDLRALVSTGDLVVNDGTSDLSAQDGVDYLSLENLKKLYDDVLLRDGSSSLTGDWDAGDFQIRAKQVYADVPTGTSPFLVESTTLVPNLNADLWGGNRFVDYLDQAVRRIDSPTFAGLTLTNVPAGTSDYDKFLVLDSGVVKYRTGDQMLSDIGAASSSGTTNDTFIINSDKDDTTVQLILDRTTGGPAILGWDGSELASNVDVNHEGSLTQLVNKKYVDYAVTSLGASYYMLDTSSGISDYKLCSLTPSGDAETYLEVVGLNDGDYVGGWISPVGESPNVLLTGDFNFYITAEKITGTKTLKLYWKMYEVKSDTSEVLIETSSISNEITNSKDTFVIPLLLASDYIPDSDSRIVGKLYASVTGSGNAPTVRIYYQGGTGSRWDIPANTEVFRNVFVPYVGAVQDVDLGSYSLTANDLTITSPSNIYALDHDSFSGFVADEHVAHSGVSIIAGTGLTGGGTIAASRTLNVDSEWVQDLVGDMVTGNTETFIIVTYQDSDGTIDFVVPVKDEDDMASNSDVHLATQQSIKAYVDNSISGSSLYAFKTITGITNDVVADATSDTLTLSSANAILSIVGNSTTDTITFTVDETQINHDNLSGFVANEHVDHSSVSINAGTGLSGGGDLTTSRTLALSHLGLESLSDPNADRIMFWDDSEGALKWLRPGAGLAINTSEMDIELALPSDENLVGYWSFDDGTGTVAVDGSGNGNNGTLVNMEEADWVDGVVGKCLSFDGSGEYVDCGADASLDLGTNSFSVSFWLSLSNNDADGSFVTKKTSSYSGIDSGFTIMQDSLSTGTFRAIIADGSNVVITNLYKDNMPANDTYHHVLFVFDRINNEVYMYLDGIRSSETGDISSVTGSINTEQPLKIGAAFYSSACLIDEVRIYNRALTPSEIKALYLYPAGNKGHKINRTQVYGLTASDSPTFTTVKLSNLTDGYVPYHVSDASGLANSPIYTDGTNVGIGTAYPGYALDIFKDAGAGTQSILRIVNSNTTFAKGLGPQLYFGAATGTNLGYLSATMAGSSFNDGSVITLKNRAGNYGYLNVIINGDERVRISSNGNVGFRTTNPQANVEIEDGGTSNNVLLKITADDSVPWALMIGNDTYSTDDTLGLGFFVGNSGSAYIINRGAEDLYLQASGTINASDIYLRAEDKIYFQDYNDNSPSTKIIMDMQNGRLGIGVIPDVQLDVLSPTDEEVLRVCNYTNSDTATTSIVFRGRDRGGTPWITGKIGVQQHIVAPDYDRDSSLIFYNADDQSLTERMRINYNGNVLIGTTTDNAGRLQVLSTSEQLRLEYDNSHYTSFTVGSGGNLTITPIGNLYVSGASIVLPASEYLNFGGTQGSGGYGIRDNSGTMEYKNSGGSWTAIGSGGSFTSKARAHRSGDQTIPNETWTKVQLDVEDYDVAGEFDNTTNYRFTATSAGYYLVTAAATFSDIPDGKDAAVAIETTGGNTKCRAIAYSSGSTDVLIAPVVADIVYLNAGEYLELWVAHHGGAGIEVVGGTWATYMSVHRLS